MMDKTCSMRGETGITQNYFLKTLIGSEFGGDIHVHENGIKVCVKKISCGSQNTVGGGVKGGHAV
jgi:hypothetical protein